ncbi:MAG: hypothetical protein JSS27_21055 [Planctomycetes bacterium]|nr:hypothetical protein [Planctomycetota bacterium]
MSTTDAAPQPKRRNPLATAAIVVVGIAAIVAGAMQIYRGLGEIAGGLGGKAKQAIDESDKLLAEAKAQTVAAAPLFQELMTAVDAQGLEAARQQHREAGQKAIADYAEAAKDFRQAAEKADEVATGETNTRLTSFLKKKSESYRQYAEVCELNRQLIAAVLDEANKALEPMMAKLQPLIQKRDAVQKSADAASVEADEMVKKK